MDFHVIEVFLYNSIGCLDATEIVSLTHLLRKESNLHYAELHNE